jgi:hypothetical protein
MSQRGRIDGNRKEVVDGCWYRAGTLNEINWKPANIVKFMD